ncbi:hypothetical protein Scep_028678 [Stephania cephalantha]|uniref:Uncharacterized protein n=1 Tax=Stephania cephalantha TaxID=152367 RepID=A0AAP0HMB3_9MAGN
MDETTTSTCPKHLTSNSPWVSFIFGLPVVFKHGSPVRTTGLNSRASQRRRAIKLFGNCRTTSEWSLTKTDCSNNGNFKEEPWIWHFMLKNLKLGELEFKNNKNSQLIAVLVSASKTKELKML